jgi:DnaJ-class molecular chaperone
MVRQKFDYEHYSRCPDCEGKFLKILKIRLCPNCKGYLRYKPRTSYSRQKMELKRY